jgi:hypothetical protein
MHPIKKFTLILVFFLPFTCNASYDLFAKDDANTSFAARNLYPVLKYAKKSLTETLEIEDPKYWARSYLVTEGLYTIGKYILPRYLTELISIPRYISLFKTSKTASQTSLTRLPVDLRFPTQKDTQALHYSATIDIAESLITYGTFIFNPSSYITLFLKTACSFAAAKFLVHIGQRLYEDSKLPKLRERRRRI